MGTTAEEMEPRTCEKCNRLKKNKDFYNNKFSERSDLCKACETMFVDSFELDSFDWLLKKYDVPYLKEEWDAIRDKKYQKDPKKFTHSAVFGEYLRKMKLKQFKNYGYEDAEKYYHDKGYKTKHNPQATAEKAEAMRQAYENGEISEAQYLTYQKLEMPDLGFHNDGAASVANSDENPYAAQKYEKVELPTMSDELTEEDKIYLATKWGRFYSADDWVWLERKYDDFMDSFDIQGAARLDTLIMICKTSLKINQALDAGDTDTYTKMSRAYDALMKSAKFTEAQRKEERLNDFDSVGQVVLFAEKHGGKISRTCFDYEPDLIDAAIENLKNYSRALIEGDSLIMQQIEQFLQRKQNLELAAEMEQEAKQQGVKDRLVTDKDFTEFSDFEHNLSSEAREVEKEWA